MRADQEKSKIARSAQIKGIFSLLAIPAMLAI